MIATTQAMNQSPPVEPRLSATILFLRDSCDGLTVFMTRRSSQVEFATNALVFPGGKVVAADRDPALALAGHEGLDPEETALRVAGLREAYEEAGLLRALAADKPVDPALTCGLDQYRDGVDRGALSFAAVLADAGLVLDVSGMVRFAHWITPRIWPKRFDTHFFLCPAPAGQEARVDGREIEEALWLSPAAFLQRGATLQFAIMFPTRMVLSRLQQFDTTEEALAKAPVLPVVPCEPMISVRDGVRGFVIPDDAGYDEAWEPLDSLVRGITNSRMTEADFPA
jgi:8-oxo-dGTP pyrophosphatase MutT (NUDIX family)